MKYFITYDQVGRFATGCTTEPSTLDNVLEINKEDYKKLVDGVNYPEYEGQYGIDKMFQKYKLQYIIDNDVNFFQSHYNTY